MVTAILAIAWTATASNTSGNGVVSANKTANALVALAYPKTTGDADAQLSEGLMSTNGLVFDFHNVPLNAVLSYLSVKAGLIIVSDVDLQGRVNLVAERPVATNEIVDLLGEQLAKNNYAVALTGRTLTIMDAALAKTSALTPVIVNKSGPKQIPINDGIVTEILPVHSLQPAQLVKDLASLIPAGDTVTASETGNAIIMTASQKDVHRFSEIMAALDSSSVSDVEVFVLQYADAKSIVSELKEIFQTADSGASLGNSQNDFGGPGGPGGPGGGPPGGGPPGFAGGGGVEVNTKNAQTRAVFVADDQMNAIIASAPPASMNTVSNMIAELDRPSQGVTEIHVLPLKHADPGEIADELSNLFASGNAGADQASRSPGFQFDPAQQASAADTGQSPRMNRQSTMLAVADRRTQSVIVTASKEMMKHIRVMVQDLDRGGQGVQKVTALNFGGADPATVQQSLSGLFSSANSSSSSSTQTSTPLANRYSGNANSQSSNSSTTASLGGSGSGTSGAH